MRKDWNLEALLLRFQISVCAEKLTPCLLILNISPLDGIELLNVFLDLEVIALKLIFLQLAVLWQNFICFSLCFLVIMLLISLFPYARYLALQKNLNGPMLLDCFLDFNPTSPKYLSSKSETFRK